MEHFSTLSWLGYVAIAFLPLSGFYLGVRWRKRAPPVLLPPAQCQLEHSTPLPAQDAQRPFVALHPYWAFRIKSGVRMLDRVDAQRVERMDAPRPELQSKDWLKVTSNNHGFFSKRDYPYHTRNSGDFLVGVFGGSVARWFCLQRGQYFAGELAANLGGHRNVEILNFAQGAFKQPQSMHVFAHFLMLGQRLDAVLLLDGFNEASHSWMNLSRRAACAMPAISYIKMFPDVPGLYESEIQPELPVSKRVEEIASQWEEGARIMREICRERAIPFFHVLQPNQYYSKKRFSEEELEMAISETTPYREGVRLVYPELVTRMRKMRRSGWNAFDATGVFDDCMETTYSDNCCHYNRLGNTILQDFILTSMLATGIVRGPDGAHGFGSPWRGIRAWLAGRKVRSERSGAGVPKNSPKYKDDLYPMW